MNREEAAAVLDAIIFGVYPDDDITINKIGIEAVRFAICALREPKPDPITGLMPCGCGGIPKIHSDESYTCLIDCVDPLGKRSHFKGADILGGEYFWVVCSNEKCKCSVGWYGGLIFNSAETARNAWNISRGWRVDK